MWDSETAELTDDDKRLRMRFMWSESHRLYKWDVSEQCVIMASGQAISWHIAISIAATAFVLALEAYGGDASE